MKVLGINSFGIKNAQKKIHVYKNDTTIAINCYDVHGNEPWTDSQGKCEVYVDDDVEGTFDVAVGDDRFYVATVSGAGYNAQVRVVAEAPAEGTPSNVISVLLAE